MTLDIWGVVSKVGEPMESVRGAELSLIIQ